MGHNCLLAPRLGSTLTSDKIYNTNRFAKQFWELYARNNIIKWQKNSDILNSHYDRDSDYMSF